MTRLAKVHAQFSFKGRTASRPLLYRDRNAIERMFCCPQGLPSGRTRYDRLTTNFLATVCISATVSFRL
ncbi:MAG: hypothetical protein EOS07_34340 [Mesorhizobium sp.]|nr:MAG: hypothetical protein EOS07_34340 [Mesorhizobium sp.]